MLARTVAFAALSIGCGRMHFESVGELAYGVDGGADGAFELCPANAFICDDFESGSLSRWSYIDVSGTASTTPTTTRVLRGAFSLESRMLAGPADGQAGAVYTFGSVQSTGTLAVRFWFNTPVPLVNFNLLTAFRSSPTGQYVTLGGSDTATWVSTTQDSLGGSRDYYSTVPSPPLDTWMCVELVVTFGVPGRIQAFVDDVAIIDEPTTNPAPAYSEVIVGVARGDSTSGYYVFVDDVAVAPQRLRCS